MGGNEEAARRSGIRVGRIYVSVFALSSSLAALGGLLAITWVLRRERQLALQG